MRINRRFLGNCGEVHAFEQIGNWLEGGGLVPYLLGGGAKAKKDSGPEQDAAPDPNAAVQTAKDAQTADRKKLLATGGQTKYAGDSGMLLGDNINTINLTGA